MTREASDRCFQSRELALHLLSAHGLSDWSFAFNRSKRQMGCCRYDPKSSNYLVISPSGTIYYAEGLDSLSRQQKSLRPEPEGKGMSGWIGRMA